MAKITKVTSEFLKYCVNDHERKIIEVRMNCRSNIEAAKELGISRQTVDKIVNRIKLRMNNLDLLYVKGTSTLYDKDGNVKLQWVKTDIDKDTRIQALLDVTEDLLKEIKNERKKVRYTLEHPYKRL